MKYSPPLLNGQWYYPEDNDLIELVKAIYTNKYYTNYGPLASEFEASLSVYFSNQEVVVSTNAMLGLMMTLVGMGCNGSVIVPAVTSAGVTEAVIWAGLKPIFADVDITSGQITVDTVNAVVKNDTSVIIAISLWGNACEIDELATFSDQSGLKLIHYAVDAFGISVNGKRVGNDDIVTVFSFDSSKILSSSAGGCVVTNDNTLARRIRNIRSSYGSGPLEKVPVTANGRFSEFQAAIGLWSLSSLESHRENNRNITNVYKNTLVNVCGLNIIDSDNNVDSNHQDFVLIINETESGVSRDYIQKILEERGVFTRPEYNPFLDKSEMIRLYHDGAILPGMKELATSVLQLPVGARVTPEIAANIGGIIKALV